MRNTILVLVLLSSTIAIPFLPSLVPPNMRTTFLLLLSLSAAASAIFLLPRFHSQDPPAPVVVHSQGPTVEKLERLSQLVALRIEVADILVAQGNGCRGVWLLKGDSHLSVDMGQAKIADKHDDTKQATIILPEPQILAPRIDHSRTRTWSVERVAWLPWNADQDALRDAVYAEGQKLVAHTAASPENIKTAKMTAETILKSLYAEVGWTLVVKWPNEAADSPKTAMVAQ
jgi:hypothetical protein